MMADAGALSADPRPVPSRVLDEAIDWRLRLEDDPATDRDAFRRWHDAHPDHARAWRQLDAIDAGFRGLPRDFHQETPLRRALVKPRRRRATASVLGLVFALLLGLAALDRFQPLSGLLADYRTGTGDQRRVVLPDNTVLVLNTRSAVDVEFGAKRRAIRLRSGEIHVQTGHGDSRPFLVLTADGSLRALGTRFLVRRDADGTEVTVTESAVLARPARCPVETDTACPEERRVPAGSRLRLGATPPAEPQPARPEADAWKDGMLAVEDMPLETLAAELSRYRPGLLTVAPEVARLRVTGTVPLADTDHALAALTRALPVRLTRHGSVWLRIEDGAGKP